MPLDQNDNWSTATPQQAVAQSSPPQPNSKFSFGNLIGSMASGQSGGGNLNIGPALSYLFSPNARAAVNANADAGVAQAQEAKQHHEGLLAYFNANPGAISADEASHFMASQIAQQHARLSGVQTDADISDISERQKAQAAYRSPEGQGYATKMLNTGVDQAVNTAAHAGAQTDLTKATTDATKQATQMTGKDSAAIGGGNPELAMRYKQMENVYGTEHARMDLEQQMQKLNLAEQEKESIRRSFAGYSGMGMMMNQQNPEEQKRLIKFMQDPGASPEGTLFSPMALGGQQDPAYLQHGKDYLSSRDQATAGRVAPTGATPPVGSASVSAPQTRPNPYSPLDETPFPSRTEIIGGVGGRLLGNSMQPLWDTSSVTSKDSWDPQKQNGPSAQRDPREVAALDFPWAKHALTAAPPGSPQHSQAWQEVFKHMNLMAPSKAKDMIQALLKQNL